MSYTLPYPDRITTNSEKSVENRILKIQFGNGYGQVAKDGLNSNIETWNIEMAPISGTRLTELQTFFDTVDVNKWFYWTPFGESVAKKWRIVENTFKQNIINTDPTFRYTFTIRQVFDLDI